MSYMRANEVLPAEVLAVVQQYVEGEMLYIPKRSDSKRAWGAGTETKKTLELRNARMYDMYCKGVSLKELSDEFFLTEKSVQRIMRNLKPSEKICDCKDSL